MLQAPTDWFQVLCPWRVKGTEPWPYFPSRFLRTGNGHEVYLDNPQRQRAARLSNRHRQKTTDSERHLQRYVAVNRPCQDAVNPKPSKLSAMPNNRCGTAFVGRHNNPRP